MGDKLDPRKIFNEYMKNSAGAANMNIDGSASATPFYISCPADTELLLERCLVTIYDTKGFEDDEYGDTGGSLSAGLTMNVMSSDGTTVLADLMGGLPVKTNEGWARLCYDFDLTNLTNTTNAVAKARWTFSKGGNSIFLTPGQRLEMIVDDDLTGLLSQYILVQGFKL